MKNSKDAHIEQLLQERQSLMECNQNLNSNNIKINDENKILKKAVNIQENRLKDLNNQNSTLQGIVSQAADYVVTLENTIVQLRQQLDRNTDISSNYIIPPRPPDVY
jgi:predicted nuclease with TOPRIM domain